MSKRLITDRDLASGAVRGPIVLDGNTLLTPSARDRAARMGIAVVEAGAAPAPWSAAAGADAGLGALPDGLYLVRIEGGRPVSVHAASGPGLVPRAAPGAGAGLRGGR